MSWFREEPRPPLTDREGNRLRYISLEDAKRAHPKGKVWPCGHPRTDENARKVGFGREQCRICRGEIDARYHARKRDQLDIPASAYFGPVITGKD